MNGMASCSSGDNSFVDVGETCTVTCDTGYMLVGTATRTCQSDGMLSGTEAMCSRGNI